MKGIDDISDIELVARGLELCVSGNNPTAVAKLSSGWVVFGLTQLLPGYCVLLADPQVGHLNDLDQGARAQFLTDMALVGDVIAAECQPLRVNYEILGNELPVLHAHIRPRYEWEPEHLRRGPSAHHGREAFARPEHSWRLPEHLARRDRLRERFTALVAR